MTILLVRLVHSALFPLQRRMSRYIQNYDTLRSRRVRRVHSYLAEWMVWLEAKRRKSDSWRTS